MPTTKHHLTKGKDFLNGNSGSDLFLAPLVGGKPTLSGKDVLNGRGGIDTISATLTGMSLAPVLKNIEKGIFGWKETASFELDLAKAASMRSLVLDTIESDFDVFNASALNVLALRDTHAHIAVRGIDAAKTSEIAFFFTATSETTVEFSTLGDAALKSIDVTLDKSSVNLSVNTSVSKVAIHSMANSSNQLNFTHLSGVDHIRTITIDGGGPVDLMRTGGFAELRVIDARHATARVSMVLDSPDLVRFLGGHSDDGIRLVALGGTAQKPALIALDDGVDLVNAIGFALDGALLHISGGAGTDTLLASGAVANSTGMLEGVEKLIVQNASGSWHLDGSGVSLFNFSTAAASTTVLDQIQSGATLIFQAANGGNALPVAGHGAPHASALEKQASSIDVLVKGAAQSQTDSLTIELHGGVQIGDFTHGVSGAGLSDLRINSIGAENMILIGSIGGIHDSATLTISGDFAVTVAAIDGAHGYIDTVKITNSAGVNLVGLTWGLQAFDPGGATIVGGAGDDVLVGGAGADVIRTGAGDNDIYGSGASDAVYLKANSGLDTLHYSNVAQSIASGGMDAVHNFAVTDTIDIASLVDSFLFKGNVDTYSAGLALLSNAVSCAFFDKAEQAIFIDINHDGTIDAQHDLGIHLIGVDSIQSWNILA